MLDPELLQDIAIQIRLDNPAPDRSMGYADYEAALAIKVFADAIDKIAARRMEQSFVVEEKSVGLRIEGNYVFCPFCKEHFIEAELILETALDEAFHLHLYNNHPRKYNELYIPSSN